jgi:hypothetical protein
MPATEFLYLTIGIDSAPGAICARIKRPGLVDPFTVAVSVYTRGADENKSCWWLRCDSFQEVCYPSIGNTGAGRGSKIDNTLSTYIDSILRLVQVADVTLNTELAAFRLAGFTAYHAMHLCARISQLPGEAFADIAAAYDGDLRISFHLSLHLWSCSVLYV